MRAIQSKAAAVGFAAHKNINARFTAFKTITERIDLIIQRNRNYDTVELSKKALELLGSKGAKPKKLIDCENSPTLGSRSQAQWAESALTQQRNGVVSVKSELGYQRKRLETVLSRIGEYEKIASGEIPQTDTRITAQRADELIESYRNSVRTDFSAEINSIVKFYNGWAKQYDEYSGGLASEVTKNILDGISGEALGLGSLSDDPEEIFNALDSAIKNLDDLQQSIESAFFQATGGEKQMTAFYYDAASLRDSERWSEVRLSSEIAAIEGATIDENTETVGKSIEINF